MAGESQGFAERVQGAVETVLEAEGFELVLAEFVPRASVLRLYVDSAAGVTIDDCARVSHLVGDMLDAEGLSDLVDGQYTLEVSSPGLDRPLTRSKDYKRFVGSDVKLSTRQPQQGRRKFTGRLAAADDAGIEVVVDGKPLSFAYDVIERARLVPTF